jgi:hypothetical protein
VGMSELRFIARFDEGDDANAAPPDQPFLELHPLGCVENCYRWAGETDVFEAIEDACRRYRIDRDRIVLRGMSMGASGTWHLGEIKGVRSRCFPIHPRIGLAGGLGD